MSLEDRNKNNKRMSGIQNGPKNIWSTKQIQTPIVALRHTLNTHILLSLSHFLNMNVLIHYNIASSVDQ